jgi:prepilin-type N-terminal cleavage/methylation domain-containing protein
MICKSKGFTLVELLLAMGIIGLLAALTISALNPAKQMAAARNTQRKFDVNTILNSFGQYSIDNGGFFQPETVGSADLIDACKVEAIAKKLCKADAIHGTGTGECGDPAASCVWSAHLKGPYTADIPLDPSDSEKSGEAHRTDYEVSSQSPGRFRVDAPNAEHDIIIGAVR